MGKTYDYVGTLFEEWRPVKDYEGLYEISNEGRVRSLNYHREGEVKELRVVNVRGYLQLQLCKDGKTKIHKVHRLVWEAFRGKIPHDMQINHLDENKLNNWLENLEVCTPRENSNWGTRNERAGKANKKALIGNTNAIRKPVHQIDKLTGEVINTFHSAREAERQTGINHRTIAQCCKGKFSQSGGYVWRYVND